MMTIKTHPQSAKHIIIENPTPAALALAARLAKGNWAKVQPSGNIVAHINNGKAMNYLREMTTKQFNARFAGKTAAEVEEFGVEMTKELKF